MEYNFLAENFIIIVPVIYIIGMILKSSAYISDRAIPILLLFFGIVFACLLEGPTCFSVMQGILATGMAVYSHEIYKQYKREV